MESGLFLYTPPLIRAEGRSRLAPCLPPASRGCLLLGVQDYEQVVLLATEVGHRADQFAKHLDRGIAKAGHHSDRVALLTLSVLHFRFPCSLATSPSGLDLLACHALAPLLVGG